MLKSISATIDSLGGIPSSEKGAPNGVATLDAGGHVPVSQVTYASANSVNNEANIGSTVLYAVPVGAPGLYRVSAYAVVSQAATTSSTLPNVGVLWTDNDANVPLVANTVTPSNNANAPGAFGSGDLVVNARDGTNISFQTSNYASVGATAMRYALHMRLEFLG